MKNCSLYKPSPLGNTEIRTKTEKSNRDINLLDFLCEVLEDYFGMLYKCREDSRLFEVSKHYLQHEMKRGCKESGVKKSEFMICVIHMWRI